MEFTAKARREANELLEGEAFETSAAKARDLILERRDGVVRSHAR
jgi:hypothetical protein